MKFVLRQNNVRVALHINGCHSETTVLSKDSLSCGFKEHVLESKKDSISGGAMLLSWHVCKEWDVLNTALAMGQEMNSGTLGIEM